MEELFGWLMSVGVVGLFLNLYYLVLTKDREQTLKELRQSPVKTSLIFLSSLGTLSFFLWLASFGRLAFVIQTPWFNLHSAALGFALGLIPFFFGRWRK
jgi:hypothetical protein